MEVRIIVITELPESCAQNGKRRSEVVAGGIETAISDGRWAAGGDAVVTRSSAGADSGTSSSTGGAGAGSSTPGEELESETMTASEAGETEETDSDGGAVVCTDAQITAETL